MAIRFMIRNTTTNTTLASRDLTNEAVIDDIREVFPGTPVEAAEAILAFMLRSAREHVREQIEENAAETAGAAVQTAQAGLVAAKATRRAVLNSNWPEA